LLMGVGTLGCLYALAKRALPQQPEVALGALVLAALNPQFIFISASVNNDNLVILLSTAALGVMARWAQGEKSLKTLGIGGALIGLACLSKLSALGLVPLAGLALALHPAQVAWVAPRRTGRIPGKFLRQWLGEYALVIGIAALLAGWWYLRNWALYGDPTGLNAMLDVFGKRSHQPTLAEMWHEFRGLRISFWGLFGVVNILLRPPQIYLLLDALMLLSIAGLVRQAVRRIKSLPHWLASLQAPVVILLAAWGAIIAASLLHWTSQTKASQGRLLFPAIASFALFMA
ncbi:MAG: glycosyltransferase family 39 protein, partial [Chloroflexi bacterium]|nr:glycosyltransferase family 39 protein [Chloroflexota bacterium]